MEKSNSFKRVVAGTLALATVFGSAPATLQGVFAPTNLVASAKVGDRTYVEYETAKSYIQSIVDDGTEYTTAQIAKNDSLGTTEGKVVTIVSRVPLVFTWDRTTMTQLEDDKETNDVNEATLAYLTGTKKDPETGNDVPNVTAGTKYLLVKDGGKYAYTYVAPAMNVTVAPVYESISIPGENTEDVTVKFYAPGKAPAEENDEGTGLEENYVANETYTIWSTKPFNCYAVTDTEFKKPLATGAFKLDGLNGMRYTATLTVPEEDVFFVPEAVDTNFTYSMKGNNALLANSKNVVNAPAAKIYADFTEQITVAKYKTLSDEEKKAYVAPADGAKDTDLVNKKDKTEIADGASKAFTTKNIQIHVAVGKEVLHESALVEKGDDLYYIQYKATVKKGDKVLKTVTVKRSKTADGEPAKYSVIDGDSTQSIEEDDIIRDGFTVDISDKDEDAQVKAGKYTVELTVYGKDVNEHGGYNLKYNFTVNEIAPLEVADFDWFLVPTATLEGFETNEDLQAYVDSHVGKDKDGNRISTDTSKVLLRKATKNENGVVEFEVPANVKPDWNTQFSLVAFPKAEYTLFSGTETIRFQGEKSGSTKNRNYNVNLMYEDSVYGKGNLGVNWIVNEEVVVVNPDEPIFHARNHTRFYIEDLETQVFKWAVVNDNNPADEGGNAKFDAKDITYKYAPYMSSLVSEEFDDLEGDKRIEGLPGEDYLGDEEAKMATLYVFYKGEEVTATAAILTHKPQTIKLEAEDVKATFTEAIDFNKVAKFTDASGNEIKDENLSVKVVSVTNKATGSSVSDYKNYPDGYYFHKGTYTVTLRAVEDYDEVEKYDTDSKSAYTTITVTVNPKQLTADLISITPAEYDGTKKDIVKLAQSDHPEAELYLSVVDPSNPWDKDVDSDAWGSGIPHLNVTEGYSVSEVTGDKPYGAEVIIGGDGAVAEKGVVYGGDYMTPAPVSCTWRIVNKDITATLEAPDVTWNEKGTTIKSNSYLRFQVDKTDACKGNKDKKNVKIGVIFDRNGVVDRYDYDDAAAKLRLNNGFETGGKVADTYGFAVSVKDVDQLVAARIYALYEDGTVSYGEIRFFTLRELCEEILMLRGAGVDVKKTDTLNNQEFSWLEPFMVKDEEGNELHKRVDEYDREIEAEDALAYTAADAKAAAQAAIEATEKDTGKKLTDKEKAEYFAAEKAKVQSGYNAKTNQYYLYCEIDQIVPPEGVELALEANKFGCVFERTGECEDVYDARTTLVLGSDNKNVKVGNYNKNNTVLSQWEYGAKIAPVDTVTGVWARFYVDFGGGLVVYTEPFYIPSVSEIYGTLAGTYVEDHDYFGRNRAVTDALSIRNEGQDYFYNMKYSGALVYHKEYQATPAAVAAIAGVAEKDVKINAIGVVALKTTIEKLYIEDKELMTKKIIRGEEGVLEGVMAMNNYQVEDYRYDEVVLAHNAPQDYYAKLLLDMEKSEIARVRGWVEYVINGKTLTLYTTINELGSFIGFYN